VNTLYSYNLRFNCSRILCAFSICSNCTITNTSVTSLPTVTPPTPSQPYTVDKQCQLLYGPSSFYCAVSSAYTVSFTRINLQWKIYNKSLIIFIKLSSIDKTKYCVRQIHNSILIYPLPVRLYLSLIACLSTTRDFCGIPYSNILILSVILRPRTILIFPNIPILPYFTMNTITIFKIVNTPLDLYSEKSQVVITSVFLIL